MRDKLLNGAIIGVFVFAAVASANLLTVPEPVRTPVILEYEAAMASYASLQNSIAEAEKMVEENEGTIFQDRADLAKTRIADWTQRLETIATITGDARDRVIIQAKSLQSKHN